MVATTFQTDLSFLPGTRYIATDMHTPLMARELLVDRLVRDDLGMLHIVMLDLEGREVSVFAEQLEAAIAAGLLVAIDDAMHASA